jgi:hypothetical protein
MTYQSLNPATGKLLKKFVELTDKRPPAVRTQMAGVSSPVTGYPLRPLNSDFESTITALSNRTANGAILESIIGTAGS